MRYVLIKWLILTLSIIIVSNFIDGIYVGGFFSAFFSAVLFSFLNMLLKPIILYLIIPVRIRTFAAFIFTWNTMLLTAVSGMVTGFTIKSFEAALLGSLFIGLVSLFLTFVMFPDSLHPDDNKIKKTIDLDESEDRKN